MNDPEGQGAHLDGDGARREKSAKKERDGAIGRGAQADSAEAPDQGPEGRDSRDGATLEERNHTERAREAQERGELRIGSPGASAARASSGAEEPQPEEAATKRD